MKYAILKVSPYMFLDLAKNGTSEARIIENAIPQDAKFIRAFCDDNSAWGYISLVIESETFEDLEEGNLIPTLAYPIAEKVYKDQ